MPRISNTERNQRFGNFGHVTLRRVETPWGVPTMVHAALADVYMEACKEAAAQCSWRPQRIDSYNPRLIRGSSSPSMHGWCLAWDIFATGPTTPPPGGVWHPTDTFADDFARCFERRGFYWGQRFGRQDWPHMEWPGPPPGGRVIPAKDDEEVDVLVPGSNDKKAVELWQRRLGEWLGKPFGANSKYGEIDGDYGPKTTLAVKDAQKKLGLRRTGFIDAVTMNELTFALLRGGDGAGQGKARSGARR
ncbi:MAG: peptidoglycan-binding protein [Actinomycetota bacterium]|nr:peptidoglycan-binding protein [Actinomycetota bacterium]